MHELTPRQCRTLSPLCAWTRGVKDSPRVPFLDDRWNPAFVGATLSAKLVSDEGEITFLLRRWREGDAGAENELFTRVLPDLRRLARYLMSRERKGHSLQATELVDQIYFRLVDAKDRDWQNRGHFFAIAGRAMRRYLIDHARGRPNAKFVAVDDMQNLLPAESKQVLTAMTVDRLLERLSEVNPDWCTVVEVKYFLGLTDEEAAEALGMKLRTMQRIWLDARKWLFSQMESQGATQSAGR